MRCPRCRNQVPDTALRCPECKLPKPKTTRDLSGSGRKKNAKDRSPKTGAGRPKWVNALASVAALLLVGWVGIYLYSFLFEQSQELDSHVAQPALAKLRQEPSLVSGLNVDEYMTQQLEKSRRVGNLLKYQGWTVSPVRGSKTKLLIAFSYEERDNTKYSAEWIADTSDNSFTPQTELAAAAYKK